MAQLNFHLKREIALFIRNFIDNNFSTHNPRIPLLLDYLDGIPSNLMKPAMTVEDARDLYFHFQKNTGFYSPNIDYLLKTRFGYGLVFYRV